MGKRTSQLTQLTAAQVAQGDFLPIVDVSAGQTKYVTVKDLTGLPDTGWLATGESWSYSSWDSARRMGVVTVPTDATTKYTVGNRVRFSQTTGGTKYAIIHAVTATTLTLHFSSGVTLANEAITSPVYSVLDTPIGFNKDATIWQLETKSTVSQLQASPVNGTWYNVGSNSLALGKGSWRLDYEVNCETLRSGGSSADMYSTLSTANNTESDKDFTAWSFLNQTGVTDHNNVHAHKRGKNILLAADATYYLNLKQNSSLTQLQLRGADGTTRVFAVSAYL